jgi:predicted porin
MKKSLLALAVFGAFVGAAQAQSNVTLYGVVDVGFVHDSGAVGGSTAGLVKTRISSGVESGSRLGVRGVEDLGNGLKAKFVAETGFGADTNASGFCTGGNQFMGRQAYVGLEGGFGSLTAGRQYNPWFLSMSDADPFGTGLAGNIANNDVPSWFVPMFGVGAIVVLPIIYGIMGLIGGAIAAALYNLFSGMVGGVELDLQSVAQ